MRRLSILLALASLPFAGCSDSGTAPAAATQTVQSPVTGRWVGSTTTEGTEDSSRVVLDFPRSDSLIAFEERLRPSGEWEFSHSFYAGRIAEVAGERIHLENASGSMARDNPEGWLRIHVEGNSAMLFLESWRAQRSSGAATPPEGGWTFSGPLGTATLDLRADHSAILRLSADESDSGSWRAGAFPDRGTLEAQGLEPGLAAFLAGRNSLSMLGDLFHYEAALDKLWIERVGDGALIHLEKAP